MAELTVMAQIELTSRRSPIFRTPRIKSGTFITKTVTPTGRAGSSRLRIWAAPVSPPKAKWLG